MIREKKTTYNALGWKLTESVWGDTSLKMTYSNYDRFGRVGKIQPPGGYEPTKFTYKGERPKTRESRVRLEAGMASAFTTEYYNNRGKLVLFCEDQATDWYMAKVDWREPPPELEKVYVEGDADIIVLFPSREFARVLATAFRLKGEDHFDLCQGCGFSVRSGSWREADDGNFIVTDLWIKMGLPIEGNPTEEETSLLVPHASEDGSVSSIEFDSKTFYAAGDRLDSVELLQGVLFDASAHNPTD